MLVHITLAQCYFGFLHIQSINSVPVCLHTHHRPGSSWWKWTIKTLQQRVYSGAHNLTLKLHLNKMKITITLLLAELNLTLTGIQLNLHLLIFWLTWGAVKTSSGHIIDIWRTFSQTVAYLHIQQLWNNDFFCVFAPLPDYCQTVTVAALIQDRKKRDGWSIILLTGKKVLAGKTKI